ncbi:DUF4270 domain-containing protein [Nonlabens sp.]|uniref:DUF4270 domain-containing protein n=1 Tax=Nonlabens sp. TaxID=1888209 RepID=UPI0025EE7707|nr:DUF4270 domain-containing protein [Nonlabens sp.]
MKKMLCNAAVLFAVLLGVVSCENELTPLGANFLGVDPSNVIKEAEFDVKTYSIPVNTVQTNNFNSIPFGVYDDPAYGRSSYSFVAQINPNFTNPSFGQNKVVEEVILEVPYYSIVTGISGEEREYKIDSLYGIGPTHFQIYRNNYFLSGFDQEDVTQNAIYYSDFESVVDMNRGDLIYENTLFFPDNQEIDLFDTNEEGELAVSERLSPRLRISLPVDYWETVIVDQEGSSNLESVSNFQNYFRGLYFKIAGAPGSSHMVHLDMNNAKIDIKINSDFPDVSDFDNDGDTTELNNITSNFRLNFNGNRVVFINNDFNASILSDIADSNDPVNGAENIYLKGGPGSIAVLELFGQATTDTNGEAPALTEAIENNWLINDAYIDFYVNRSIFAAGSNDPERILIYDYDTNRLLSDYAIGSSNGLNSNLSHLGRLERIDPDDTSTDRIKYRIRLTQHLSNIIRGDAENNRLAIVVSQNVSIVGNNRVLNTVTPNSDLASIPISAAISHEGTVLYGNLAQGNLVQQSIDGEVVPKKPLLKVFYSETIN